MSGDQFFNIIHYRLYKKKRPLLMSTLALQGARVHQSLEAFYTYSKCSVGTSWRWWQPSSLYLGHQIHSWTHLAVFFFGFFSICLLHLRRVQRVGRGGRTISAMYTQTPTAVDYPSAGLFSDILCPVFDGLALDMTQHKSTRLLIIAYYNAAMLCFICTHSRVKLKESAL